MRTDIGKKKNLKNLQIKKYERKQKQIKKNRKVLRTDLKYKIEKWID